MSTSMFRCDHCDITMTGPENYQQHIEGKKHLKKLKASGMTPATQPMPAENKPVQVKAKGYEGRFVKPSAAVSDQDNYRNEGKTEQHFTSPESAHAVQFLQTNNADPVMNAVKANLLGKLPLKNPLYQGKCDICEVEYTSKSHEEQHLSGKKHKRKFQTKEALESQNGASFYCGFCNLHVNSIEQMDQHRSGSSHNKKVENAKNLQQRTQLPHSAAKKKFVPSSGIESSDNVVMPTPPLPPATLLELKPLTYDK